MPVPDPKAHEEKAIGEVRERLRSRFTDRNPAEVTGVVDKVARRFTTARVREYIPLLVERISRDELSHRGVAAR
jgi:hypothetical protein